MDKSLKGKTNKYIIAGSGDYGRRALTYYGNDNVEFFMDNDPKKQGNYIDGIKVCSFELLRDLSDQYRVIVAVKNYEAVVSQLTGFNVNDYIVFSPIVAEIIENIPRPEKNCGIILFGYDIYTRQIIDGVIKEGWKEDSIIIAERKRIIENKQLQSCGIKDIEQIDTESNVVMVSSAIYAYGIEQYKIRNKMRTKKWINPFLEESYYPKDKVIINTYTSDAVETTEEKWIKDRNRTEARESLEDYYFELNEELPIFSHIEIETVNRCNGKCSFCPVSVGHDVRTYAVMEDKLFYKIIDELEELDYRGRIALFSNNEPFIDKRIIMFHEYARRKLANARFHLYTNGSLLTLEKFISIIEYLDELIIDNYNQELELNDNSRIIYEYIKKNPELISKVDIVIRKENEVLSTRGGDAPNREVKISYDDVTCTHPLRQMIIRPDGKVSLCCNDPYGRATLGDVTNNTLKEIWYGEAFSKIREQLKGGRGNISYCKYCDFFGCK